MKYENVLPKDEFMFGANYAPYVLGESCPEEEYDRDMQRMKSLNFNTIRIFVAWSRIEVKKDQYDFSALDKVFEAAARNDLKVIVNLGGVGGNACGAAKPWYLRKVVDFCYDNPYIAERQDLLMRKTVERYRDEKQLIGWIVWGEPNNLAHCMCEHTMKYFRKWLQDKYGTIEKLCEAWSGGEPVCFESFEEIDGVAGHAMAGSLDRERFHQWNLARRAREIEAIIRSVDRDRFSMVQLVYHAAATEGPENSVTFGSSMEQMGCVGSIMGASCYIMEHRYDVQPAWEVSYKLSRLRTISPDVHHRMLVVETGAGPNIRQLPMVRRNTLMWQQIAHNVKGMTFWNYRSRIDGGQVALFQLMGFDGGMTERAAALGKLSMVLQKNAHLLNSVYPAPKAAVLTLEDTMLMQGVNYPIRSIHSALDYERVQESRFGAYKLLWDMKISADCLTEQDLDRLDDYQVLLLPAQEQMTEKLADALKAYVSGGGCVIAEGPMGFRNEEARLIYRAPGYGLEEVFGCYLNDRQKSTVAPMIEMPDGEKVPVCDFYSVLHPVTAEVICCYDGEGGLDTEGNEEDWAPGAALTLNRYGKGIVLLAGTEIFRQYSVDPAASMTALLKETIIRTGILPEATLSGDIENVEAVRLITAPGESEDQVLYLLINHSAEPAKVCMKTRETTGSLHDIITGTEYSLSFEKTLGPWEVIALHAVI